MPPAPLYFRFRRFPEKIIDRKSLKIDILTIFKDGGTIPNMNSDNSKHFLKKKTKFVILNLGENNLFMCNLIPWMVPG